MTTQEPDKAVSVFFVKGQNEIANWEPMDLDFLREMQGHAMTPKMTEYIKKLINNHPANSAGKNT